MPGRFLTDEHISRATISAIRKISREYQVTVDLVRVRVGAAYSRGAPELKEGRHIRVFTTAIRCGRL